MQNLRARITSLVIGIIIGAGLTAGTGPPAGSAHAAPKAPKAPRLQEPPARLVVGLKGPLTPGVVKELKRTFRDRIVQLAPLGQNTLVLLRRGETLEEVQRQSSLISYVEPEVVMGAAEEARASVVLIPSPKWPAAPKAPKK